MKLRAPRRILDVGAYAPRISEPHQHRRTPTVRAWPSARFWGRSAPTEALAITDNANNGIEVAQNVLMPHRQRSRPDYSVVVTGCANSGSWSIRGQQLGGAIGATVAPLADLSTLRSGDLIVVAKRFGGNLLDRVRASGKPWVLDFVDGWPQPRGNAWSEEQARPWLQQRLRDLNPFAVVFATGQMLRDSDWEGPTLVLPHHAWPKYARASWSDKVHRVGYEGQPGFLGRWRTILNEECAKRGWEFVENGDLSTCQIGVALRDVSGYPPGAWKANTKLANIQALGLPALVSPEQGYRDFGSSGQIEISEDDDVGVAFDRLADPRIRAEMGEAAFTATPRLATIAERYRTWLASLAAHSNDLQSR